MNNWKLHPNPSLTRTLSKLREVFFKPEPVLTSIPDLYSWPLSWPLSFTRHPRTSITWTLNSLTSLWSLWRFIAGAQEIVWTYDVKYEFSDIRWASRWDIYMRMSDDQESNSKRISKPMSMKKSSKYEPNPNLTLFLSLTNRNSNPNSNPNPNPYPTRSTGSQSSTPSSSCFSSQVRNYDMPA